ncbi:MAG: cyclic nucleotide-binding protein [Methylomonas sp.]|jgi:CRP-like cAMP-binding protein|nr:MAG: cyclic nucleotide-binding protein [Methylomonas sp.]
MKQIIKEILSGAEMTEGNSWTRTWYKSGDKIIEKDEIGSTLFLVEEGSVRVYGGVDLDRDLKVTPGLCDLEAGSLFGDICLYGKHRRIATVKALTDACVLEIRSDMLSEYLDAHPATGYFFLKGLFEIMAARVETANERIEKLLAWGIKAHDIDKYL